MCTCDYAYMRPEEGIIRSYRAGVTDGCELPHMERGNQTQVFCKTSKCSRPLNPLPRPQWHFFIRMPKAKVYKRHMAIMQA